MDRDRALEDNVPVELDDADLIAVEAASLRIPLINRPADSDYYDLGPMRVLCLSCGARHWVDERKTTTTAANPHFTSCCLDGAISLPSFQPLPANLRQLLLGDSPQARTFRRNIRAYNSSLAFTSLSCTTTDRGTGRHGIQVFQIHGALYHRQGPLEEEGTTGPRYAQLYFHDPQYAADARFRRNPQLDCLILRSLTDMLYEISNPYISIYRTARERLRQASTDDSMVVLTDRITLAMETGPDRRRENIPTSDEIGLVIPDAQATDTVRPIVLAARNASSFYRISAAHPSYMPLHYVLMFPHGDRGWSPNLYLIDRDGVRQQTQVSQQMYYRYYLYPRDGQTTVPFRYYRLFQQWLVDVWALCDQSRLEWIRHNQKQLRADLYSGLADALLRGDAEVAAAAGRRIILPSSYLGSSRFISQCYQDSMAIVRRFGRPTLFITFTASPYWPEVLRELGPGETGLNRPDLICRVFRLKVKRLLSILKSGIFGQHLGHVYTIEYQKRGLPHIHILLFLPPDVRESFMDPEHIDSVISAEIPSPADDPDGLLTEVVRSFMLHGPCGSYNPTAPCMVQQEHGLPPRCSKGFPRSFCDQTTVHDDGYPEYRRRNNGSTLAVRCRGHTVQLDNRWVVPYCPTFLRQFRAHINTEVCGTIHAIKYVHKYIYKGVDRAVLTINQEDEVEQHLNGRYLSPSEAVWRLLEFPVHEELPTVVSLAVHLPDRQIVTFSEDDPNSALQVRLDRSVTTLTAFFQYNADHVHGRGILYQDFPSHFRWIPAERKWQIRQRGTAIGRMYFCNPLQGERYYLRLLLTIVRGPTSFADLRTFNGTVYPTFQAAAAARGLLQDDGDWTACFREAVVFQTGFALRLFFAAALLSGPVSDPLAIWTEFQGNLCDDLPSVVASLSVTTESDAHLDYGLYLIGKLLAEAGKRLTDFSLPTPRFAWAARPVNELIAAAQQYNIEEEDTFFWDAYQQLNTGQHAAFSAITDRVASHPEQAHFFVHGPAGTGKTFLWRSLCAFYRSRGEIVLCVASSGIAALLLPGGRTAHSQFRIPINIHEDTVCPVPLTSDLADLLRATVLVIWDEVPMQHRYCFEAVHRMLQDVRGSTALFGGLPMVFGGDFAQILPVVRHGQRPAIVAACLQQSSEIWPAITVLHLTENMRVLSGEENQCFADWARTLATATTDGPVSIPAWLTTFYDEQRFFYHVYPPGLLRAAVTDFQVLRGRAILAVRNDSVAAINRDMLSAFPGTATELLSEDTAEIEDENYQDRPPPELLQSFEPPSLPPSRLQIKVGAPVILLRNLYPKHGLCNGTRMVITRISPRCLEARILSGDFAGQLRLLSRIKLSSTEGELPFIVTRTQFPIRLSFAITVNKSQGQSLSVVGVDLRHSVFTHGQLYVAMSRVTTVAGQAVLLPKRTSTVRNIVYSEVLL